MQHLSMCTNDSVNCVVKCACIDAGKRLRNTDRMIMIHLQLHHCFSALRLRTSYCCTSSDTATV